MRGLYHSLSLKPVLVVRIALVLYLCITGHGSNAETITASRPQECPPDPSFTRPFTVALVADPQIGWNTDGYNSERLFQEAVQHLQEIQPDFVLVAGDLVQTPRSESQRTTAKTMLDSLPLPYHVIAGNHDVQNKPSLDLLNDFVEYWKAPSYWYTIRYYDTLFVMLDSNTLRVRDDEDTDRDVRELAREQLRWLQDTLQNAEADDSIQQIVPIAHHPLATRRLNEDSANTNMPKTIRRELATIYSSAPKIKHVFAGHFHDTARIYDADADVEYITYPSTGVILGGQNREPSGFSLLQVVNVDHDVAQGGSTTALKEQYYGYNDMPSSPQEAADAGFSITYPLIGEEVIIEAPICIRWTSTSMAPKVRLDYSIDDGTNWSIISDNVPNDGVFSWTVPFLSTTDNALGGLLRISSMRDAGIAASAEILFGFVLPDAGQPEDEATAATNIPTDNLTSLTTDISTLQDEEKTLFNFESATAHPTDIRATHVHTAVWGRDP